MRHCRHILIDFPPSLYIRPQEAYVGGLRLEGAIMNRKGGKRVTTESESVEVDEYLISGRSYMRLYNKYECDVVLRQRGLMAL